MFKLKNIVPAFVAAMLLSPAVMSALSLPVKRINGKAYYYYTVGKKDRFYELSSKIGVKRSDILRYNPQAADGLQTGMVLTFPVEMDAEIVNGYYTTKYSPSKDESIYGVAKHFDVSVDRIIEFNPEANEGIRDLTLVIPLDRAESKNSTPSGENSETGETMSYTVQKGETLTKIAANFNTTVYNILAVNPGLNPDKIAAGKKILIPLPVPVRINEVPTTTDRPDNDVPATPTVAAEADHTVAPADYVSMPDSVVAEPVYDAPEPLKIAILQPFMLSENEMSKSTQLVTEFYRGFLMGAETLSHDGDPITIYAFDTAASNDTLASVLSRPELQDIDVYIGPGDETQLSMIAEHANRNGGYVLNMFAIKDTCYKTDSKVIQANIPHGRMYDKAIDYFVGNRYKGFTPVFISRIDGAADKAEFVAKLKERLDADNIQYKEIAYRNFLGQDNLEDLNMSDSAYVFVPVTGSRLEFNKFAPALKNFKNSVSNPSNIVLFGYPEWIMFRNEQLDMLQSLNTLIYSRFFGVASSPLAEKLNDDYKSMYGIEMMDAAPGQGLLGYDTAVFLIKSLRNNEGDFHASSMDYDGVQSGFNLVSGEGEPGLVNENLYFIDFLPGGITTKVQF